MGPPGFHTTAREPKRAHFRGLSGGGLSGGGLSGGGLSGGGSSGRVHRKWGAGFGVDENTKQKTKKKERKKKQSKHHLFDSAN